MATKGKESCSMKGEMSRDIVAVFGLVGREGFRDGCNDMVSGSLGEDCILD